MLLQSMSLGLNVEGPPPSVPATICSIAFLHTFSLSITGQDHTRILSHFSAYIVSSSADAAPC